MLQLPVNQLRPFEGNPYQVKDDAEMVQLSESIQIQGILTPLTVRPLDDGHYEVISGHADYMRANGQESRRFLPLPYL